MRTRALRSLLPLALLSLAAPLGARQSDVAVLHVYSARHYDVDRALYEGFEQASGIRIELVEGKDDALLARLASEGQRSPADVFVTVDAARLWLAEEAGLFQPVRSDVLEERIPAHLRHPDGLWFGLSTRARCIVYAKERVQESELSTYADLAAERWRGRVLVRSSSNVYNQSLVASLIARNGEEQTEKWARGLVANFARKPQGGDTDQIRAVAAGEGDVALVNSYYFARLLSSDDPKDREVVAQVALFFPNQDGRGTHVNVSGAGVLKTCADVGAAVRFLEYLSGDAAQRIFALGNNEFPAAQGVPLAPALEPWKTKKLDAQTSVAEMGRRNREAILLMDRAGWR